MKKVLVIEDNEDNLRIVTYALNRDGYQVISAKDGVEGVNLALKEHPYFIIMDINLPGVDGLETTRRIRSTETGVAVPIIAVTSYAMTGDRERILSAGCNGYIEKPIDPIVFVAQIHGILGEPHR